MVCSAIISAPLAAPPADRSESVGNSFPLPLLLPGLETTVEGILDTFTPAQLRSLFGPPDPFLTGLGLSYEVWRLKSAGATSSPRPPAPTPTPAPSSAWSCGRSGTGPTASRC